MGIQSQQHTEKASMLQRLIYLSAGHAPVHGAARKCVWDAGPAKCHFSWPRKCVCFPQWGKPHPGHSGVFGEQHLQAHKNPVLPFTKGVSCPRHIAANKVRKPGEIMPVEVPIISSTGKKAETIRESLKIPGTSKRQLKLSG